MAFAPYVRLVIGGTIGGTQTWSLGLSVSNDGTATNSELFTWLGAVDGLTKTWLGGNIATAWWSTQTNYQTLRAYSYPAVGGAHAVAGLASSGVVGNVAAQGPSQLATVCSLRTGLAGRSGRGRFYIPVTTASAISTNGQISASSLGTTNVQTKTFLDALNLLTIGTAPAVAVIAGRDSGQSAPVISMTWQSKIHTQRKRTDKIANVSTVIQPL